MFFAPAKVVKITVEVTKNNGVFQSFILPDDTTAP